MCVPSSLTRATTKQGAANVPDNEAPLCIKTTRLVPLLALVSLVSQIACQRDPLASGATEPTAEVALALSGVPADVACVAINVAAQLNTQQRRFDVKAGDSTFVLARLPVGLVVFSVEALASPCAQAGTAEIATWYGGPVSATLKAGLNTAIAIEMRPNGQATVSVGFDGGAGPTCAPLGAVCASGNDCCSQRCSVDPSVASGIGTCAVPVADAGIEAAPTGAPDVAVPVDTGPATPKTVTLTLEGGTSYLFYPFDGGTGCQGDSPETYQVRLFGSQEVCVDDAVWTSSYPVRLINPKVCTAGMGCTPCTTAACRPEACFKPVPVAANGTCNHRLTVVGGAGEARYLFFKKVDPEGDYSSRPKGLPRVINNSDDTGTFVITPPAGQGIFTVGELSSSAVPEKEGDSCGGQSLCGIVPFTGWNDVFLGGWFFSSSTNLLMAPLF
jgi:hypothetical protein